LSLWRNDFAFTALVRERRRPAAIRDQFGTHLGKLCGR